MRFVRFVAAVSAVVFPIVTDAGEVGSLADREALFEWIVQKTQEREAYSDIKYDRLGVDVVAAMESCRQDVVQAETEVDLYFALAKLSAARRDRHLDVYEVPGGLSLDPAFRRLANAMGHDDDHDLMAPIQLRAGFSDRNQPSVFVAEVAKGVEGADRVQAGDRVTTINGEPINTFAEHVSDYWRFSTTANFWSRFASELNEVSRSLPPRFYQPKLVLELVDAQGESYELELPYLKEDQIDWRGVDERVYPGFKLNRDFVSFDIYEPTDGQQVLLLQWYGFRSDLTESIDSLMQIATRRGWLDYDLIIDCTRSRGGSRGAYAVQHLCSRPFRTTFGNLRLSDAAMAFTVETLEQQRRGRQRNDGGIRESVDRGGWLADWLTKDVLAGFAEGQAYSNNVPFKCAHAPRYSDGVIDPAANHFRGKMVCWFGPHGGSHLDQFASIIRDNRLAFTIGMPTGGYSNTWEWEEEVRFPTTGARVIGYMWSIGHTIRPNGEVLEGNPADVDIWMPVTASNYSTYYRDLTRMSLAHLERMQGVSVTSEGPQVSVADHEQP